MLIEFKFKNFTSYKDENSILLTRVKSFKVKKLGRFLSLVYEVTHS